ncbi:murein transglycosylase domain-containing protein [Thiomicrorhabdus aquaedulcis]|uniref:murein transglycosylase domain-containing protein n=1 Tax=Thiomicrorhabdus aquaedulcis TaxID=2211106 RepID=UPI000FD97316|nr:murein transglycosylase domain-containing protein [Thiomicrorhabdus aquaedulcis]
MKNQIRIASIILASGGLLAVTALAFAQMQEPVQIQVSTAVQASLQANVPTGAIRAIHHEAAPHTTLALANTLLAQTTQPLIDNPQVMDEPSVKNSTPLIADVPTSIDASANIENDYSSKLTRPGELISAQSTDMVNLFTTPITPMSADQELSLQPVIIWYDHEIIIEYPQALVTPQILKRSIARLLLSPDKLAAEELLSLKPIKSQQVPALYLKVRDQNGKAIRYPADAYAYVDYLIKHQAEEVGDDQERFTLVHIPITKRHLPNPVQAYQHWVQAYSERFKVSQDIVFAIMEVESAFNPKAVSKSEALGLMQVQAHTAGKDVYELVDRKQGMPGRAELFDPQNNIRMGVAYFGLLNHDYLKSVSNPKSKEMLAISSYNGGFSTVLKLFGKNAEEALAHINRLHPQQVYRILRYDHPSDETRNYLDKVMHAKSRYTAMLDLNV